MRCLLRFPETELRSISFSSFSPRYVRLRRLSLFRPFFSFSLSFFPLPSGGGDTLLFCGTARLHFLRVGGAADLIFFFARVALLGGSLFLPFLFFFFVYGCDRARFQTPTPFPLRLSFVTDVDENPFFLLFPPSVLSVMGSYHYADEEPLLVPPATNVALVFFIYCEGHLVYPVFSAFFFFRFALGGRCIALMPDFLLLLLASFFSP